MQEQHPAAICSTGTNPLFCLFGNRINCEMQTDFQMLEFIAHRFAFTSLLIVDAARCSKHRIALRCRESVGLKLFGLSDPSSLRNTGARMGTKRDSVLFNRRQQVHWRPSFMQSQVLESVMATDRNSNGLAITQSYFDFNLQVTSSRTRSDHGACEH